MEEKIQWLRYRFSTKSEDPRPLIFNPSYPWWVSGYGGYGGMSNTGDEWIDDDIYTIIIAFLPADEDLKKYWDDAYNIDFTEQDSITFSERFPKPEYFVQPAQ